MGFASVLDYRKFGRTCHAPFMVEKEQMKNAVRTMLQKKLAWSVVVLILVQITGMLPALDWLPQNWLKGTSFLLGVSLTVAKGVEMYFDTSARNVDDDDTIKPPTMPSI